LIAPPKEGTLPKPDQANTATEEEPLHRRLETPRLFKLMSLIRRSASPSFRRDLGLSDFEWRIMSQVGDRAPMSLNELAMVTSHDKGQLSRGVKRLVQAGLLVRESRRGERGVFISPTKAGAALFDRLANQAVKRNIALTKGLTAEELAVLSRVIDKLEANALEMLAAEQDQTET
jgi:DNA-binding MarR family transcriptional regulator